MEKLVCGLESCFPGNRADLTGSAPGRPWPLSLRFRPSSGGPCTIPACRAALCFTRRLQALAGALRAILCLSDPDQWLARSDTTRPAARSLASRRMTIDSHRRPRLATGAWPSRTTGPGWRDPRPPETESSVCPGRTPGRCGRALRAPRIPRLRRPGGARSAFSFRRAGFYSKFGPFPPGTDGIRVSHRGLCA